MIRLSLILLFISSTVFSQKNYNLKKGFIANGYDVVEYFNNKAVKGKKTFTETYDGVKFKFSSNKNKEIFKKSPLKFFPKYGGFCAYAIGKTSEKVAINPKTFEIRKGELYLFYNGKKKARKN